MGFLTLLMSLVIADGLIYFTNSFLVNLENIILFSRLPDLTLARERQASLYFEGVTPTRSRAKYLLGCFNNSRGSQETTIQPGFYPRSSVTP